MAEVASPKFSETVTEMAICPYADVRTGGAMNRSALRQMTAVWPDLLDVLSVLAGPSPTVGQAWAAVITGVALPLVAPTPTPRLTAALFKASLGLSQVLSAMLLTADGVADAPLTALGDAPGFFTALDEGKWLVGAEQVCAGTRPMIEQAFEALAGSSTPVCPAEIAVLLPKVRTAPEIVALHVAHLASLQAAARRGDGPSVAVTQPWLRAVLALPNRPAEHALRLFPTGCAPASLRAYLDAPRTDRAAMDAALQAALSADTLRT